MTPLQIGTNLHKLIERDNITPSQYAALLEKTCQLTRQAHDESIVADALIFLPPTPGAHASFYDEMTSRGMRLDMVGYRYYWV